MSRISDPHPAPPVVSFGESVRAGLTASPKQLDPQHLYDPLGSALFDAICELPWYRIPSAERRLLARFADDIGRLVGDPLTIVELGPGTGGKIAQLLGAIGRGRRIARVHLIDVSSTALAGARRAVRRVVAAPVTSFEGTYHAGVVQLAGLEAGQAVLVLFLGSNIGNFEPATAVSLLRQLRAALPAGGGVLLGADLVKPARDLMLAYDDPLGVTAAFNRNILVRMNRELGSRFALDLFAHRARWLPVESRVEMHLEALSTHDVVVPAASCTASFGRGETIWTESSYKYERDSLAALAREAGFALREQWVDSDAAYSLSLFFAD